MLNQWFLKCMYLEIELTWSRHKLSCINTGRLITYLLFSFQRTTQRERHFYVGFPKVSTNEIKNSSLFLKFLSTNLKNLYKLLFLKGFMRIVKNRKFLHLFAFWGSGGEKMQRNLNFFGFTFKNVRQNSVRILCDDLVSFHRRNCAILGSIFAIFCAKCGAETAHCLWWNCFHTQCAFR